jgi:large subunit ribosomal protein L29
MLAREVRTMKTEQIEERLGEACRELFGLRRDKASGRLDDHNRIQILKRDIARMKTILRERELGAELNEGGEAR